MLANAHRQDLERVDVVSEVLRWEGDPTEADNGSQFWNRPLNSNRGPKPHLLGTRLPQSRPMVSGMLLNPTGTRITLDDKPIFGGVLQGVTLSVESDHSLVCVQQTVTLSRDFRDNDPDPPVPYLTGQFDATYQFAVIPASVDGYSHDVVGFQGDGTAEGDLQYSCYWVIGEIWRDENNQPQLTDYRPFSELAESVAAPMTNNPLFLPYRGFGYFGGGITQQVGLLTS
jgi:hypothetical protein